MHRFIFQLIWVTRNSIKFVSALESYRAHMRQLWASQSISVFQMCVCVFNFFGLWIWFVFCYCLNTQNSLHTNKIALAKLNKSRGNISLHFFNGNMPSIFGVWPVRPFFWHEHLTTRIQSSLLLIIAGWLAGWLIIIKIWLLVYHTIWFDTFYLFSCASFIYCAAWNMSYDYVSNVHIMHDFWTICR